PPPSAGRANAAARRSSLVAAPSARRSATLTAFRLSSLVSRCQSRRQQATANNLSFRSLTFPRMNPSSRVGSGQPNHSTSVIGSLLAQQQVHHPASTHMVAPLAQVVQPVGAGATCFFQSIGKDGETGGVKCPGCRNPCLVSVCGEAGHRLRDPYGVD